MKKSKKVSPPLMSRKKKEPGLPWPYNAQSISQVQPLLVKVPPMWLDGRFVAIKIYPKDSLIKVTCCGCGHTIQEVKLDLFANDPRLSKVL